MRFINVNKYRYNSYAYLSDKCHKCHKYNLYIVLYICLDKINQNKYNFSINLNRNKEWKRFLI